MMRHKLAGMMLFSMATAGLVACSDKLADESGNGLEGSESYVYMNVAVALPSPSTTRSGTDDPTGDGNDQTNSDENKKDKPDYEYGYEFENKVNNLLLVIAAENNEYITHTFISDITDAAGDGVKNNFTTEAQKFSRSDITAAYGDFFKMNPADNKYYAHIYAFCNPTTALKARFDDLKQNNGRGNTEWVNWTNENEADDISLREKIWGGNGGKPEDVNPGFLMSNKDVKRVEFPSLDGWSSYSSPSHPFKLSTPTDPVRVERTAARIDYKDGSSNNDNTIR